MKRLIVLCLILFLTLSSCYWRSQPATGSITIVLTGLENLWWSDEVYARGDIVWYDAWYVSLQDDNVAHRPYQSPDWWGREEVLR